MHTVSVSTHISATPERVWSAIGDPGAISEWHPVVSKSSLDGTRRLCTLADGALIDEQIDEIDEANRSYTYRIVESPLPLSEYLATLRVVDAEGGCSVEWASGFEVTADSPEDTIAVIKGVYDAGLTALRDSFRA